MPPEASLKGPVPRQGARRSTGRRRIGWRKSRPRSQYRRSISDGGQFTGVLELAVISSVDDVEHPDWSALRRRRVLALWSAAEAEPTRTDTAEHLDQLISHDPLALIVAEDAGSLVGTVVTGWDGWRARSTDWSSLPRIAVSVWAAAYSKRRSHGLPRSVR